MFSSSNGHDSICASGHDVYEACCTCIKLYSQMNHPSGVNRAWEALKSAFPNLNNTGYLFMLLALSTLEDQQNLEKLFKEWEEGCSKYDFRLPNVLLEFYLSQNMIQEANLLYQSSLNRGTGYNLKTLNLFTVLCIKNCQIDSALKYLDVGLDKAREWNRDCFPTDETTKLFLNYFEENNDAARTEKFIQSMKKANRSGFNSLLLNTKAPGPGS